MVEFAALRVQMTGAPDCSKSTATDDSALRIDCTALAAAKTATDIAVEIADLTAAGSFIALTGNRLGPLPYEALSWLAAWADTVGRTANFETFAAIITSGGKPGLVLPLAKRKTRGMTTLTFAGFGMGNQNTGLWDADFYQSVTPARGQAVLEEICRKSGADRICLRNVPETWEGRRHPFTENGSTASPSPVFRGFLERDFDALFRRTHSKSARKNLARKERHLKAIEGYKVVKASAQEQLERGLDAFLTQRADRARSSGVPNAFHDPDHRRFLERLLGITGLDPDPFRPALDLWYLEASGTIRATYLVSAMDTCLFGYANSIAEDELMPHSPGLVLLKSIIEQACEDGLEELDLGLGDERYKHGWTSPVPLSDCHVAVTWKGRLASGIDRNKQRLKAAVRRSSKAWMVVRYLRKLKGRMR